MDARTWKLWHHYDWLLCSHLLGHLNWSSSSSSTVDHHQRTTTVSTMHPTV
jgi:hypothetical protein